MIFQCIHCGCKAQINGNQKTFQVDASNPSVPCSGCPDCPLLYPVTDSRFTEGTRQVEA